MPTLYEISSYSSGNEFTFEVYVGATSNKTYI